EAKRIARQHDQADEEKGRVRLESEEKEAHDDRMTGVGEAIASGDLVTAKQQIDFYAEGRDLHAHEIQFLRELLAKPQITPSDVSIAQRVELDVAGMHPKTKPD